MDIATKQAEMISAELKDQLKTIGLLINTFKEDPSLCATVIQGRDSHPTIKTILDKLESNQKHALLLVWNRCFNFGITPKKIIPFNWHRIINIIQNNETDQKTIKEVGLLIANNYQPAEVTQNAIKTLQQPNFKNKMEIPTQGFGEHEVIKDVIIDMMAVISTKNELSFNVENTLKLMRGADGDTPYKNEQLGVAVYAKWDSMIIELSSNAVECLNGFLQKNQR